MFQLSGGLRTADFLVFSFIGLFIQYLSTADIHTFICPLFITPVCLPWQRLFGEHLPQMSDKFSGGDIIWPRAVCTSLLEILYVFVHFPLKYRWYRVAKNEGTFWLLTSL